MLSAQHWFSRYFYFSRFLLFIGQHRACSLSGYGAARYRYPIKLNYYPGLQCLTVCFMGDVRWRIAESRLLHPSANEGVFSNCGGEGVRWGSGISPDVDTKTHKGCFRQEQVTECSTPLPLPGQAWSFWNYFSSSFYSPPLSRVGIVLVVTNCCNVDFNARKGMKEKSARCDWKVLHVCCLPAEGSWQASV